MDNPSYTEQLSPINLKTFVTAFRFFLLHTSILLVDLNYGPRGNGARFPSKETRFKNDVPIPYDMEKGRCLMLHFSFLLTRVKKRYGNTNSKISIMKNRDGNQKHEVSDYIS